MSTTYFLAADGAGSARLGLGAFAWVAFRDTPTASGLIGLNYATDATVSDLHMLLTGLSHALTFLSHQEPGTVRIQLTDDLIADIFFRDLDPDGFFRNLDPRRYRHESQVFDLAQSPAWRPVFDLRDSLRTRGFRFVDARDAVHKTPTPVALARDIAKIAMNAVRIGTHLTATHPLGNLPDDGLNTIMTDIFTHKDTHDEDDLHYCC